MTTTTVRCPRCGAGTALPIMFEDVVLEGNGGMNFRVQCGACGNIFDAAPRDGRYSTIAGKLELVAAAREATARIAQARPTAGDLRRLEETIAQGRRAGLKPAELADGIRGFDALKEWAKENPALFGLISGVLTTLLGVALSVALTPRPDAPASPDVNIVVVKVPSEDLIRELIDDALDERRRER